MRNKHVVIPVIVSAVIWVTLSRQLTSQTTSDTIRVCTYNLLNFGGDDVDRVNSLRSILTEVDPHILIVQELSTVEGPANGYRLFSDSVAARLDLPLVEYAEFNPGDDSYNAIFVDTTHLEVLAVYAIEDEPRSHIHPITHLRHILLRLCHYRCAINIDSSFRACTLVDAVDRLRRTFRRSLVRLPDPFATSARFGGHPPQYPPANRSERKIDPGLAVDGQ